MSRNKGYQDVLTYDFGDKPNNTFSICKNEDGNNALVILRFENDGSIDYGDLIDLDNEKIFPMFALAFHNKKSAEGFRNAVDLLIKTFEEEEKEKQ